MIYAVIQHKTNSDPYYCGAPALGEEEAIDLVSNRIDPDSKVEMAISEDGLTFIESDSCGNQIAIYYIKRIV